MATPIELDSAAGEPIFAKRAEDAVLGSLLIDGTLINEVIQVIGQTPEAFYDRTNGPIYEIMVDLHHHNCAIDILTVDEELTRRGWREQVGGFLRLTELVNGTPTPVHAVSYAVQMVDAFNSRRKAWAAQKIVRLAYQRLPARELDAKVADVLREADLGLTTAWRGRILGETLAETILEDQAKLAESNYARDGLFLGIGNIDKTLKPVDGGDLEFLLAPTSTGKTTVALMALRENAQRGHRPVFYFNELSMKRLRNRLTVMESVNLDAYRSKRVLLPVPLIGEDDMNTGTADPDLLNSVLNSLHTWVGNVIFVPAHGWSADDIVADFTLLWSQGLCDMVLVDYLDLVKHDSKADNGSEVIGDKLMVLKNGAASCKLPKTDGIPIMVTGQPPKGFASNDIIKRPAPDDAFGSVRPSQFAAKFLTLWRERDNSGPTGYTLLRIEKNPDDGNEGYEERLRVAGTKDRRGFTFYAP